jgi:hypothetical protein
MRRSISLLFCLALLAISVAAQETKTFDNKNADYTFEFPNETWRAELKGGTRSTTDFIYGDRMDGYLVIRKVTMQDGDIISDLVTREEDQRLRFLPSYVGGKQENFKGNLDGRAFNYEFTQAGKNMSGRMYFLKADDKTVYLLRFTGLRDKLKVIRNQTDSIARTFKLK